eukprot:5488471-Pyramimonas_sp.AAC.1
MAVVGFLDDPSGSATAAFASILPQLKTPPLPLGAFFDWAAIPLCHGDAGVPYPPCLNAYPQELRLVLATLTPAQIEAVSYTHLRAHETGAYL